MHRKKLISTLLAVLALSAFSASYAAGAASPAPGAKKLLKRRVPAPAVVLMVDYEPSGEHSPNLHYAVEGSLPSIKRFFSKAGQPSANRPSVPSQGAKGLPTPIPVHSVAVWPILP